MLTAFYIFVAAAACFVILSLAVVRAHEKKLAEKTDPVMEEPEGLPVEQEEEFFASPLYIAMEYIAHM